MHKGTLPKISGKNECNQIGVNITAYTKGWPFVSLLIKNI
jgi:hypothetical protein